MNRDPKGIIEQPIYLLAARFSQIGMHCAWCEYNNMELKISCFVFFAFIPGTQKNKSTSFGNDFTQADLMEIARKWYDKKYEGEARISELYSISQLFSDTVQWNYTAYAQPPLTIIYLFIVIFIFYIFVKEKMLGFVNVLLILSNIFEVIPPLLELPINVVFFHFSNIEVPMPYPWCHVYLTINDSLGHVVHAVTVNLKILLAVNRICSIYYPFQYTAWFTTRRCTIYTAIAISVGVVTSSLLNFTYDKIERKIHIDDVWGTGLVDDYEACSLRPFFLQRQYGNSALIITKTIQLFINIISIIILLVCDIFLMIKLRKIRQRRKALSESRPKCTKEADDRLDLLNKVSVWVIWVMIISEIPMMIVQVYTVVVLLFLITESMESDLVNATQNSAMSVPALLVSVLTHADIVVFAILSDKIRSRIKKICCCCCKHWTCLFTLLFA